MSPQAQAVARLVDKKGRAVSYESAIAKIFTGLAFIIIACILGWTGAAGGHAWWFWMLIPGFGSLGRGIAQWMQIKNAGPAAGVVAGLPPDDRAISAGAGYNLPPAQQQWVSPQSRYKTGDLVPPSVTETTTRHLSIDSEGQTMTLPSDKE